MSAPWTPGPWKLDDEFRVLADDERRTIIHVPPCSWTNPEAQADARLIAAAPDLIEALDNLLMALNLGGENCEIENARRQAVAAMLKATGREASS